MKIFFCVFFVFADVVLFAQNNDNNFIHPKNDSVSVSLKRARINNNAPVSKHTNLWVGLNIEPQFQNIFKSRKEFQAFTQQYPNGFIERPANGGVQTGIKLYYLPPGVAGFETGLQYHLYQSSQIQATPLGTATQYVTFVNKYHSLEVPLLVDIHSHGRKVRFYSSDGMTAGITLGASHSLSATAVGYIPYDSLFITHANSSSSFYCTVLTSAGLQANLTPNILFNLTLAFRISSGGVLGATNPFYTPSAYSFVPYSLGLNTEVLFNAHQLNKNRNGKFSFQAEALEVDKQQKILDKLKAKHQSWYPCLMITLGGDTIRGKIRQSAEHPVEGFLFTAGSFLFAHTDEREEKIRAAQFKELYVMNEGLEFRKYITLDSRGEIDNREIFRVLADGKCQLLSSDINGPGVDPSEDKAFIYYKNTLIHVSLRAAIEKEPEFINRCREIFSDCPGLLQQIENNSKGLSNMPDIVRAFNECIKTF